MTQRPRISLVTPCFNHAGTLERTLRSVLDQKYENLQYILMDGGSTDGSVDIIKRYEGVFDHWQSAPDEGQTAALVAGFAMATGDILAYLNSDDVLLPGALEAVADSMTSGRVQWLVGWSIIIDEHDRILFRRPTLPATLGQVWHEEYILPQEATFFTRSMYDSIGGLDPSFNYAMDGQAWLKMYSLQPPLFLRRYLAAFRIHDDQKSAAMEAYAKELARARQEVGEWRVRRGMNVVPDRPRVRGSLFTLQKVLYYASQAGPLEVLNGVSVRRRRRRVRFGP